MWYSNFTKSALRKHNLRVDLRIYAGEEYEPHNPQELPSKLKSILSSAIIKGLDVIGVVSIFGIEVGQQAKIIAEQNHIDVKVIPGQDYVSQDKYKCVFFNIRQNIPPNLPIQKAIMECKKQGGVVMLYDLAKSHAHEIKKWAGQPYEPNIVEIYNAHSKGYQDLDISFEKVVSTAARSGSELEEIPVYTNMSRSEAEKLQFMAPDEGSDYVPKYLEGV